MNDKIKQIVLEEISLWEKDADSLQEIAGLILHFWSITANNAKAPTFNEIMQIMLEKWSDLPMDWSDLFNSKVYDEWDRPEMEAKTVGEAMEHLFDFLDNAFDTDYPKWFKVYWFDRYASLLSSHEISGRMDMPI